MLLIHVFVVLLYVTLGDKYPFGLYFAVQIHPSIKLCLSTHLKLDYQGNDREHPDQTLKLPQLTPVDMLEFYSDPG